MLGHRVYPALPALPEDFLPRPAPGHGAWVLFVGVWALLSAVGVTAIVAAKDLWIGVAIIAPLTLMGIVWKPLFGLMLFLIALPMGQIPGTSPFGRRFTIESVIGIAMAAGCAIDLLSGRLRLRFNNPGVFLGLSTVVISTLSLTWTINFALAWHYTFTVFQLAILSLLIVAIVREPPDLLWLLRGFTLSSVVTFFGAMLLGLSVAQGRFEATTFYIQGAIDSADNNSLAFMMSLAMLSAIFLSRVERSAFLQGLFLLCVPALAVATTMTGSRGGMVALLATLLFPLLSVKMVLKYPLRYVAIAVAVIVGVGLLLLVGLAFTSQATASRYMDLAYAEKTAEFRFALIKAAIEFVLDNPLGAGLACFYYKMKIVHNDLFFLLSSLGYVGSALLIITFIWAGARIRRMEPGWPKWLARGYLVMIIVMGLTIATFFLKHFWVFLIFSGLLGEWCARSTVPAPYAYDYHEPFERPADLEGAAVPGP